MSNINSLIFYLSSFFIIIFLAFIYDNIKGNKKIIYKNLILLVIIILLTVISGFRYNVGTDYHSYIRMYHSYSFLDIGSRYLFKIANFLSSNSQTIIIIYSVLTNLFLILVLKKISEKNKISLIMASYLLIFFPISFNTIRQSLAIIIIIYALLLFKENKNNKNAYLLFILAVLFHNSAVIIFPYLLITYKSKDKNLIKNSIFFTTSLIIFMFIYFYFLKDIGLIRKYVGYLGVFSFQNTDMNLLISYAPFLLLLFLFRNSIKNSRDLSIYSCLFISGIIFEVVFSSTQVSRIGFYFSTFLIILIPELFEKIKDNKSKRIIKFFYCFYLIIYFVLVFYFHGRAQIFPYDNILLK